MTSFVEIVLSVLNEENVAGSGGPLGTFDAHAPGVSFNYSPQDHRLPYSLPHMFKRTLSNDSFISGGKKKYGTRKKSKSKNRR